MKLSADDLRHRITLQRPAKVPDQLGGYRTSWSNEGSLWANIQPVSSIVENVNSIMKGGSKACMPRYRLSIRYNADLTGAKRVIWEGRKYCLVSAPVHDGKKAWTVAIISPMGEA